MSYHENRNHPNQPNHPDHRRPMYARSDSGMWMLGILLAVLLGGGILFWSMSDSGKQTAERPAATTTTTTGAGSAERPARTDRSSPVQSTSPNPAPTTPSQGQQQQR